MTMCVCTRRADPRHVQAQGQALPRGHLLRQGQRLEGGVRQGAGRRPAPENHRESARLQKQPARVRPQRRRVQEVQEKLDGNSVVRRIECGLNILIKGCD